MSPARLRWVVPAAAGLGLFLALTPPALQAAGLPAGAWLGRLLLSPVCHQDPARSIFLWGFPAGVCARCLGLWGGLLAGALLALASPARLAAPARERARLALALGAAPSAIQWVLARLPALAPAVDGNLPRAATGILMGATIGAVVVGAVIEMTSSPLPRRPPRLPRATTKETLHVPAA